MKKIIITGFALFLININLFCQRELRDILDSAKMPTKSLGYTTEDGDFYAKRYLGGVFYRIVFNNVKLIKKPNLFLIEGRAILDAIDMLNDTIGVEDVSFFLGVEKNDTISKYRYLGKVHSNKENTNLPLGYFSFISEINFDDKLFFYYYGKGATTVYFIGKLIEAKTN